RRVRRETPDSSGKTDRRRALGSGELLPEKRARGRKNEKTLPLRSGVSAVVSTSESSGNRVATVGSRTGAGRLIPAYPGKDIVLSGDADSDLDAWKQLGPASVVSVRPGDPAAAKALADATGVWLAGTTDAFETDFRKLLDRGGVIGGAVALDRLPGFAADAKPG